MPTFKTEFKDYELYHEATLNWDLDFRLLSKNNFSAYLNMYSGPNVLLTRTKLNGKIEQRGITPSGFRSIVIPGTNKASFNWFHEDVSASNMMIFPNDGNLDAISFDSFDVFVFSIEEHFLFRILNDLNYKKALSLFNGNEQIFKLSQKFRLSFSQKAESFLRIATGNPFDLNLATLNFQTQKMNELILMVLSYIEKSHSIEAIPLQRKRDLALRKAISFINDADVSNISIPDLCCETKVSERTLEYAFLEKYQVTPSAYIKAIKLNKVKNELLTNTDKSISNLAGKHGFWHMGQFAADFKNQFGSLPSAVLRK